MSQTKELPPVPEFATKGEAMDWMEQEVDDGCVDNYRFAFSDDEEEVGRYVRLQDDGCCGFFDRRVKVGGRLAIIGCNYGH